MLHTPSPLIICAKFALKKNGIDSKKGIKKMFDASKKPHPQNKLLIELDTLGFWRVVNRETTQTGLQRGETPAIASYPCREMARGHFVKLKIHRVRCDR